MLNLQDQEMSRVKREVIIGLDLVAAAGVDKACAVGMLVVIIIMMIMIMEILMILRGPVMYVFGHL